MRVEVMIFGAAAAAAQADRVVVSVGPHPTVRDVLAALHHQHPALRFALPPPDTGRLAVNHAFAPSHRPINPAPPSQGGDEIALVTLVGGG